MKKFNSGFQLLVIIIIVAALVPLFGNFWKNARAYAHNYMESIKCAPPAKK